MTFVLIHSHLELCLSGAHFSGSSALFWKSDWIYTVGWIALYPRLDSSSREIIYLSDVVLVGGIYIKKLCWVFFPTRVSQDKHCVSYLCLVYLSVDLFNVNYKRTLTYGKSNMVSELS